MGSKQIQSLVGQIPLAFKAQKEFCFHDILSSRPTEAEVQPSGPAWTAVAALWL